MPQTNAHASSPPPLRIGNLTAPLPIVQGGMGVGISLSGLASAVAREGGVGVVSAVAVGMNEPDYRDTPLEANLRALRREIRRTRELTDGIVGVNIMVALSHMERYVAVAAEEHVDIVFSGAGLPMTLPEFVPDGSPTLLAPIVSSARAMEILCRRWKKRYDRLPDAVVVEGPLAGGHLGFRMEDIEDPAFRLELLVPEVLASLRPFEDAQGAAIPVIAAGGIYTGADMRRFLELGAAAVQMGTRFVTTTECDADSTFKEAYLNCREEDLILIQSPVGLPGRAIRNAFLDAMIRGDRTPVSCPLQCITSCPRREAPYCIASALLNAKAGDLSQGFAFAGANAYRCDAIRTVRQTLSDILEEWAESGDARPADTVRR